MQHLDYKGWKSTRAQSLIVIVVMVTAAFAFTGKVTADQWINLLIWAFGVYGATEVGAKGASAYREKQ